ncbi:hypothetical protein N7465_011757 [Penicillium sp. CMV-2018d]|nr:hypothetical protein N7465_011757 [Penicillium sp. CMV-2018d]
MLLPPHPPALGSINYWVGFWVERVTSSAIQLQEKATIMPVNVRSLVNMAIARQLPVELCQLH